MSKAAQIRAALAGGPLSKFDLSEKLGWMPELSPSQYGSDIGHVLLEGQKLWTVIHSTDTATKTKRPRKLKGFRAEGRERAKRAKVDKVKQRAAKQQVRAVRNTLAALAQPVPIVTPAVAGLLDSVDLLCTAIETQVEEIEKDRMLVSAVQLARRAAERVTVQP